MAKEVEFKVGNFVTPIKTGNAIGVIHTIDENKKPFNVIALSYDGTPTGESSRYTSDDLQKVPIKYRKDLPTSKSIIKLYDAI